MEAERAVRVLRQFLETDLLLGVAETPRTRGVDASALIEDAPQAQARPGGAAGRVGGASGTGASEPRETVAGTSDAPLDLGGGAAAEQLVRLREHLAADPALAERFGADPPTLGTGALPARVVFVGEPLRAGEDDREASKLLDGMVKAMKLGPEQVFRCPCLPFAPTTGDHPSPADLVAGASALRTQVRLADPEVIVTMGGAAAKAVLGTSVGITRLRGTWAECSWTPRPVPVMPTLSPSFVLRSYTKDNRMRVWADLQEVMARLGAGSGRGG